MIDSIVLCCSAQSDLGKASSSYYRVCIHCISLSNGALHTTVAASSQRMWLLVTSAAKHTLHSSWCHDWMAWKQQALCTHKWKFINQLQPGFKLLWVNYLYGLQATGEMKGNKTTGKKHKTFKFFPYCAVVHNIFFLWTDTSGFFRTLSRFK